MPKRSQRSRSLRRIKVKTPGGEYKTRYERRGGSKPKCALCKKPLSGVPKGKVSDIAKLSKTEKRPERPYGGYLCPKCSKNEIKKKELARWGYA
jgi:large subunit ribosomal protein L34e